MCAAFRGNISEVSKHVCEHYLFLGSLGTYQVNSRTFSKFTQVGHVRSSQKSTRAGNACRTQVFRTTLLPRCPTLLGNGICDFLQMREVQECYGRLHAPPMFTLFHPRAESCPFHLHSHTSSQLLYTTSAGIPLIDIPDFGHPYTLQTSKDPSKCRHKQSIPLRISTVSITLPKHLLETNTEFSRHLGQARPEP